MEAVIHHRLILWNIDETLVDVARVARDAYAEAFHAVTGRPLVALPRMAGYTDSEIFFDALAQNAADADGGELLGPYMSALGAAFCARRDRLAAQGRALPGAAEALAAVAGLPGVVQSVLTGTIRANAAVKLEVFGLDRFLDLDLGGYGSDVFPKGAQLLETRRRAAEKHGVEFGPQATVYLGDSSRDADAARTGGAHFIGVASGRSAAGELRAAGAAVALDDLSDTAAVIRAIDTLTAAAPAG